MNPDSAWQTPGGGTGGPCGAPAGNAECLDQAPGPRMGLAQVVQQEDGRLQSGVQKGNRNAKTMQANELARIMTNYVGKETTTHCCISHTSKMYAVVHSITFGEEDALAS